MFSEHLSAIPAVFWLLGESNFYEPVMRTLSQRATAMLHFPAQRRIPTGTDSLHHETETTDQTAEKEPERPANVMKYGCRAIETKFLRMSYQDLVDGTDGIMIM